MQSVSKTKLFAMVLASLGVSAAAVAAPHGIYKTNQLRDLDRLLNRVLPDSQAPTKLLYYGGPVISNAKVYAVMWGPNVGATIQQQIGDFYSAAVNSSYFDWLTEYNTNIKAVDGRDGTNQTIGRGTFAGEIVITPANTSTALQDADIQAELDHQIDAKVLPAPDDNTLFMIYLPPAVSITIDGQTSCKAFCAYHDGFKSATHGNVFYGIMPDLGGACAFSCGFASQPFDNVTSISSHELMEAVSDPFPTPGSSPAYPQAWNTSDGNEDGDICVTAFGATKNQLTAQGKTYVVQGIFDNTKGACTTGPWSQ